LEFLIFTSFSTFSDKFLDKYPSNEKRSEGKPDMLRAVVTADAPGSPSTLMFAYIHALTNLYPGSERVGVPAFKNNKNDKLIFFIGY
jgi:hypothetical protein